MKLFTFVLLAFIPWVASAQMFSSNEVQAHKARIDIITSTASKCLENTYQVPAGLVVRNTVQVLSLFHRRDENKKGSCLRSLP